MFTNNLIYAYHVFNDVKLCSFSLYVCSLGCGDVKNKFGMCVGEWEDENCEVRACLPCCVYVFTMILLAIYEHLLEVVCISV